MKQPIDFMFQYICDTLGHLHFSISGTVQSNSPYAICGSRRLERYWFNVFFVNDVFIATTVRRLSATSHSILSVFSMTSTIQPLNCSTGASFQRLLDVTQTRRLTDNEHIPTVKFCKPWQRWVITGRVRISNCLWTVKYMLLLTDGHHAPLTRFWCYRAWYQQPIVLLLVKYFTMEQTYVHFYGLVCVCKCWARTNTTLCIRLFPNVIYNLSFDVNQTKCCSIKREH
jgi:hypothetical protein